MNINNWKCYEEPGRIEINPKIYIKDICVRNKDRVNNENIKELIELCFAQAPDIKIVVLDIIESYFPAFKAEIDKYKILL